MKKNLHDTTQATKADIETLLDERLRMYATKDDVTKIIKKELHNYPTKDDLNKALSNYPTKDDLNKALSNYPTKDDLSERLSASQNAFRNEIDNKLSAMEERLDKKLTSFTNKILTAIDPLLAELETRQQDREIATAQIKEIQLRINEHEARLKQLEHS